MSKKPAPARPPSQYEALRLPYPPSVNKLFVNRKAKGKRGRMIAPVYAAWREEAGYAVNRDAKGCVRGPYALHIAATRPDARQRDLGNIEKPISDLLQSMGVIEDDCLAQKISLAWRRDMGPGVHVMIIATTEA